MAKASDLIGRSGTSGGGHQPGPANVVPIQPTGKKEEKEDHSITKNRPMKDDKHHAGGAVSGGGSKAPTGVRPKV